MLNNIQNLHSDEYHKCKTMSILNAKCLWLCIDSLIQSWFSVSVSSGQFVVCINVLFHISRLMSLQKMEHLSEGACTSSDLIRAPKITSYITVLTLLKFIHIDNSFKNK